MEPLAHQALNKADSPVFTELNGREVVARYGPMSEEYASACSGAALMDTSFRELLQVSGPDRVEFLHGMVTNDIKGLAPGSATYAAALTPKGGMVTDVRILRREEDLLLQVEPGFGLKLQEFLEHHIISEDVTVAPIGMEFTTFALFGPQASSALKSAWGAEAIPQAGATSAKARFGVHNVWILREDTWGETSFSLWVPRQARSELAASLLQQTGLGVRWSGFEASEVLRVEAGVPRFGIDMDEHTLPLEANIEHAIHYDKGCYIGQEVVARATYRGHVNRKLAGFVLGERVPPPRAELLREEKKVGWLTTAVFSPKQSRVIALGYLHREWLEPGTRMEVAGYAEGATVVSLPSRASKGKSTPNLTTELAS